MSDAPDTTLAVVSLGSNIEPRAQRLADARAALAAIPQTRVVKASSVRETEPVDVPEEFRCQRFLNQVVVCETALEAHDFLHRLQAIETEQGRVRGPVRNVPRTIDLDLVAFGDLVLDETACGGPAGLCFSRMNYSCASGVCSAGAFHIISTTRPPAMAATRIVA